MPKRSASASEPTTHSNRERDQTVRVLYALLCENATTRPDGRTDVAGVFHQLYAPGFPAQQDRLVLATAIEWDQGELGRYDFRIDLLDPSRAPVLTISGHTDVGAQSSGEGPPQTRLVMPMQDVVFPSAGTFLFQLHVGEQAIPLAPIHLIEDPDAR